MSDAESGQVSRSAAEVYEEFFVPSLFAEWAPRVIEAAGPRQGATVLDVACGTGILARHVNSVVQPSGRVVGLDVNPGMLEVARQKDSSVEWVQSAAEAMPFDDEVFDAVVSQFGLMFFENRENGIAEMARVLRPGGSLALAVWASIDESPGYAELARLVERLFGAHVAAGLYAPFSLGDPAELARLLESAGLAPHVGPRRGTARFPSLPEWMFTDVRGWTLADLIDDAQFDELVEAAQRDLGHFTNPDGTVSFQTTALIATAQKP